MGPQRGWNDIEENRETTVTPQTLRLTEIWQGYWTSFIAETFQRNLSGL